MNAPPTDTTSGRKSLVDLRSLMRIRNLQLRAKIVVEGFCSGIHRSPYHGFSVEFTEYRQYAAGDDPRYLDWKVLARNDRYVIKKFEDETNLRCYLMIDRSRSMSYGSLDYTKAEYASTLAATLAYFLYLQGDAVGLIAFDEKVRAYLPARHRTGQLKNLMHALDAPADGRATQLAAPLERAAALIRKRGMVVLISDFLAPLDDLKSRLLSLSAAGHDVAVFQVLDPAETQFSFTESALFEDAESGRALLVDPEQAQAGYLHRFQSHTHDLQGTCDQLGMAYQQVTTDRALERVLFNFLGTRTTQGRHARPGSAR